MDEDDGFRASPRSPKRGLRQTGALGSPRSAKRSRYSDSMRQSIRSDGAVPNADVGGVAKGIAATMPAVSLHESSDLILGTENIVGSLYEGQQSSPSATVANELRALWHAAGEELNKGNAKDSQSVGPGDKANTVTKASFVTDLLLQLHFPSGTGANGTFKSSRFGRSSGAGRYDTPMPKVLLDWLNKSNPTDDDLHEILREQNGYSAAESFWDVIFTCVFRGKLTQAIRLLKGANWRVADCARMDGYEDAGYSGRQLQQTELAVNRIIALLESCPAVQNNDWDIKGNEWTLFRHRVRQALDDLKYHAEEGKEEDLFSLDQSTSARNSLFGISTSSRKAESRLPSFIFDSLTDMLTTFLGDPDEVVKSACDWVEAVVGIAVWWDGEEDNAGRGTLAASRKALQRSQHSRPSDVTPSMAYRQRLRYALDRTWQWGEEEQQLQINTSSSVEVALACVFADDVGGVLAILQKWSMTITAGLAEVASASGWLEQSKTRSTNLMQTFDQSDLMVLSYGQEETRKDAILTEYAELLRGRGALTDELFSSVPVEGWQLAVQILHRLDNERLGGNKISQMLNLLPLDTDATVDQLIAICDNLGLPDQVRSIAEV